MIIFSRGAGRRYGSYFNREHESVVVCFQEDLSLFTFKGANIVACRWQFSNKWNQEIKVSIKKFLAI